MAGPLAQFNNLQPLDFAVKDPTLILNNVIANFQAIYAANNNGQLITLAQADPRYLLAQVFCLIISQQRTRIDYANKQNVLPYSVAPYIDAMGTLWGTAGARLPAASASATIQFTLATVLATAVVIPQGTLIGTANNLVFSTNQDATIPIGSTSVSISATCQTMGSIGNGLVPGTINQLINWTSVFVISAANTETSIGGANQETDIAFSERLFLLPDSFSGAGPIGPYTALAFGSSSAVLDVAVIGPQVIELLPANYSGGPPFPSGTVNLYILEQGPAFPNQATINLVYAACNDENERPTTDYLFVQAPSGVTFDISVEYATDVNDEPSVVTIQAAVQAAVQSYSIWQQSKIGRSFNPSYLTQRVMEAGASSCTVLSPVYQTLQPYQVGVLASGSGAITVVYLGTENDLVD